MVKIEKDGIPYIDADTKTVVFGFGENSLEYSWEEITEIIREDYKKWRPNH